MIMLMISSSSSIRTCISNITAGRSKTREFNTEQNQDTSVLCTTIHEDIRDYAHAPACACVRACVRVCVRACVCVYMCMCVSVCL